MFSCQKRLHQTHKKRNVVKNKAEKEFYSLIKDFSVSDKKIQALYVTAQEFDKSAAYIVRKKPIQPIIPSILIILT